jgi:predicted nucleic acid-binding protein
VADLAVVDASPLIVLARAGRLDLLHLAATHIVVPEAVQAEVLAHAEDAAARALTAAGWLGVVHVPFIPDALRRWDLGAGETAVLAYALGRPGAEAILDDLAGRRCAGTLGVPVRGTLGLALVAKTRGLVPAAGPLVAELQAAGMYLSPPVVRRALALVGE